MNYSRINTITGWAVFAIATMVYLLTVEETASYWDCGEFISVAYKLEVPHPPGAPFFLLVGRLFSFLSFGDEQQVAYWVNMVSVLSSSFTILFLFWSVTMLGRKVLKLDAGQETPAKIIALMGSGVVGGLAYTFSDSFWFSATEAEVYGLSSFFTAFVIWAILKWERINDKPKANRWLILIAYMVGLSIGVHLLNLVALPALGLIYYYHNYQQVTWGGVIISFVVSLLAIGFVMIGIIPGLPSLAQSFEVFFVNTFGLPFGSGAVILILVIIGGLGYGLYYANLKKKSILSTALLSLTFILIGYSSYTIVLIRSNYNPPIDENNPETLIGFVKYLKREQYGSRPLLYGQYFTADLVQNKQGAPIYEKGENKYIVADYKVDQVYDPEHQTILPRAYSTQGNHPQLYRQWMGLREGEKPSFSDNISFLLRYQINHMYLRYFMWNFAGRESDIKEAGWLGIWDAFEEVPEELANNKARNNFFMLPLLLGFIGLFYQYQKDLKGFSVLGILFLLMGVGLVIYLNSPPVEPRERDYIYAGSFYAFAMWIGIGVIALTDFLSRFTPAKVAAAVSAIVCLSVPTIMAAEGWDDHDRSNRYFSVDSAKNFLASCEPNAVLFTGGDNDTFPLWYAQEVEGFRTDVRVIVLSYFNTDWYISQMERRAYESEPLPFMLEEKNYKQGGPNDYLFYVENPSVKGAINLEQYLQLLKKNSPALKLKQGNYNSVPSKQLFLNIKEEEKQKLLNEIRVNENGDTLKAIPNNMRDKVVDRMYFDLKGRGLEKKDLMILDLIAESNWERPIYFNNTSLQSIGINLKQYVVQEGNAYRLLPVDSGNGRESVNANFMKHNLLNEFSYRELDNPSVYYNEDYRNFVLNHRSSFNSLAGTLMQLGRREEAVEMINASLEKMPDKAVPFDYVTAQSVRMLVDLGENEKAVKMARLLGNRADEMLTYFERKEISGGIERQKLLATLNEIVTSLRNAGEEELASSFEEIFIKHYQASRNSQR